MPPKSGLSSGTLGLKFMNRNPSSKVAPPPLAVPLKQSNAAPGWRPPIEEDEWVLPGWDARAAIVGRSGDVSMAIEVVDSYLPFMEERAKGTSAGDRLRSESEEDEHDEAGPQGQRSSMAPWQATSGKGGRRSFGGVNQFVEVRLPFLCSP